MSCSGCSGNELTTGGPHIGTAGVAAMARQAERGAKFGLAPAAREQVGFASTVDHYFATSSRGERVVRDDRDARAAAGRLLERAGALGEGARVVIGVVDAAEEHARIT